MAEDKGKPTAWETPLTKHLQKQKSSGDKLKGLNSYKESIPAHLLYSLITELKQSQGEATRLPLKKVETRQFMESG